MKDVTSKRCLALWRIMRQLKARGLELEGILVSVFFFYVFVLFLGYIWPLGCYWKEGGVPTMSFGGSTLAPFFKPIKFVLS